jgi:alpha-mannosidase
MSLNAQEAIYLVSNAHIDLSWLWTKGETIHEVCPRTFSSVIDLLKSYPTLKFSQSAAQIYEWMELYYPTIFKEIKRKVKEGQWEIVGGSWVEHNATLLCEESLVRQYLVGKRYFMKKFGVDVKIAWLPDSFGFCWSLPQVLKKCGIEFFLTFKLKWQIERMKPPIPFPYHVFWWRSADGSRVLAYHTVGSYSEALGRKYVDAILLAQLEELKRVHGIKHLLVLFGAGDHGGGPKEDEVIIALNLARKEGYPSVRFSTAQEYFERILREKTSYPTVDDELYVKTHRGTFTTEAMMKRENRRCESLLLSLERFMFIAKRFGFKYPKKALRKYWKKLLFNQVHDNIDGTSIESVYQDAATDYRDIERFASKNKHLSIIGARVSTLGSGSPIIVFNPLPWKRDSLVKIPINKIKLKKYDKLLSIKDSCGKEYITQISECESFEGELIFMAGDVPAMGYKTFWLNASSQNKGSKTDLQAEENILENSYLKVTLDPKLNYAVKIYDKRNNFEIFDPKKGGNILEVYEDKPPNAPEGEPAWNIYLGDKQEPKVSKIRLLESGPLKARIRITRQLGNSKFEQDVILYAYGHQVDFETRVDWHEKYKFAKVAFPFNFPSYWATYEIPFGVIQRYDHSLRSPPQYNIQYPYRSWELADVAKWEVPALRFVDVSEPSEIYGVSLFNDSKYGFSLENNTLRMSLLRSPRRGYPSTPESWSDQSDSPRVGVHHIRYSIYPHKASWRFAEVLRKGYEFNYPLTFVFEKKHEGELPPEHSFVETLPENVILTAFKEAEDSDDLIIRLYESSGVETEAEIKFDKEIKYAYQTDLLEWDKYQPKIEYASTGDKLKVLMSPWEIKTLRVKLIT